ncbi:MAG: helix-turn-helix transcriptional regulator, partial [Luteitalea sp.]|nr:helix-turn-helix transcriptional regulator [Luteitalea sp.]
MDEHGDALAQARRASEARDWPTAAARFDMLDPEQLTADDLAAHAEAVWWLGRTEDALRLGAAAYDAFLADSRSVEAAMSATRLGILHLARGDEQLGAGWLGHAGRLAEGVP